MRDIIIPTLLTVHPGDIDQLIKNVSPERVSECAERSIRN